MITGIAPFRGRHAVEVLHAVINQPARPLRELKPGVPPALQPILDRALAKNPDDRYQTMAAFRDELKSVMRKLSRETGVVPTEASATLLAPQRARASWLLASTLGRVLPRRVLGRLRPPLREARSGPITAAPPETTVCREAEVDPADGPVLLLEMRLSIEDLGFHAEPLHRVKEIAQLCTVHHGSLQREVISAEGDTPQTRLRVTQVFGNVRAHLASDIHF
jgi:hypothetical protein